MLYRAENDEFYYTIDKYVSVYHRATDAEVAQKMARVERRMTETEEREAECIKSAREHIVNTSWGSGTDYVAFQSNSFVWHKGDTEQEYEFEIVGASFIEGDPAGYSIELAVTLEDEPQECEYFMVLFGNEEILPSIEFSLNGETVVLPDAYRSGGTIEWDEPEESSDGTAEDQKNEPEREDVF